MGTWCGAIVRSRGRDLGRLAARHRVTLTQSPGEWAYLVGDVNLAHIEPPRFARELSVELGDTVIAFMIQTTASCESLEHWERGELLRRLEAVDGRWRTIEGMPQAWEASYFFDPSEGTEQGQKWPLRLDDDITEAERLRYEEARRDGDPSRALDLVRGGSVWSMRRMLQQYGLDPDAPTGRYAVPANWKPWVVVGLAVAFVLGAGLLGALSR